MSIHRYPLQSLLSDGIRAAFGAAATLGPVLALEVARPLIMILGILGLLFLFFGIRVLIQGLSSIELSDQGILLRGPIGRSLDWRDITMLKLAHYAAPRRSSNGWYQLTLAGGGGVVKLESTIKGFNEIVATALAAAKAKGLAFDTATGENLVICGHEANQSLAAE